MKIVSTTGATVIGHDGTEYTANDDGEFDLPDAKAKDLLKFPGWRQPGLDETPIERLTVEERLERLESLVEELIDTATSTGKHKA